MGLFVQQVAAFLLKDFVIARRRWISTIFKCFLLPTTYGIFLACIPFFFLRWGESGNGTPIELLPLERYFDPSHPLYWADNTGGLGAVSPTTIIERITNDFDRKQKAAVHKTNSVLEMLEVCTTNFVDISDCYIGLSFDNITPANSTSPARVEYTIWGDTRLKDLDGAGSKSDLETKVLPLQWAIDKAIVELTTGTTPPTPQHWPVYPNEGRDPGLIRRGDFLSQIQSYGVLPFTIAFLVAGYRVSSTVALERSTHLTSQMKSMGGSYGAQVLSWHIATSLTFLPTWVTLALVWKLLLFTKTNFGLVLLANIFTGVALVGWSILATVPFRSNPRLAPVVVTIATIAAAAGPATESEVKASISLPLCIFFPGAFYGYFLRAISSSEVAGLGLNMTRKDGSIAVVRLFIPVAVLAFVWPILAIALEHALYVVRRGTNPSDEPLPSGIAVRLSGIRKTFKFLFKSEVVAIDDLSLDVHKNSTYVLLGPDGAGKSTTLAILGNNTSPTSGHIQFSHDFGLTAVAIGIAPQQNTLYPELTCIQTLRFWDVLKRTRGPSTEEELTQLLRDCDLSAKAECPVRRLSRGQQRSLQLAVALLGGSELLLIDECTSGVDPISRRAIWKALNIHKANQTIIFTTHSPHEAEYLADHIAVLDTSGKLLASGTPVALKTTMGSGYSVAVKFINEPPHAVDATLRLIRQSAPEAEVKTDHRHGYAYALKTSSATTTAAVLRQLEANKAGLGIDSYEILGATINDIFPDLVRTERGRDAPPSTDGEQVEDTSLDVSASRAPLRLAPSRHVSIFSQAVTILWKRILLLETRYLLLIATLVIGIAGSYAPVNLIYVDHTPRPECSRETPSYNAQHPTNLSFISLDRDYVSGPATLTSTLASSPDLVPLEPQNKTRGVFVNQPDLATFIKAVDQERRNYTFSSALYADFQTKEVMIVWARPDRGYDTKVFNLYSNLALRAAQRNITLASRVGTFPTRRVKSTMDMPFVVVLGLIMVGYTSVATIYITEERAYNVQATMFSNGLANPLSLWLGHLMYDSFVTTVISIVVIAIYTLYPQSVQFLGPLWVVFWLYGIVGTLYAYVVAMFFKRPWAAFATCFLTQALIGNLHLLGHLIWESAAPKDQVSNVVNSLQYGLGFIFPANNLFRAGLLSLNLYASMCDPRSSATVIGLDIVAMNRFGSPILYLLIWVFALLFVLVHWEATFSIAGVFRRRRVYGHQQDSAADTATLKLANIEHAISPVDEKDVVQAYGVTKSYGKLCAVDNVSFSIPRDTVFAILDPDGGGKTTTLDIMCGKIRPDGGDVILNGSSVLHDLKTARLFFGVCPRFPAVDRSLSVRNNLAVYGRLRGLKAGMELDGSIAEILAATKLQESTDLLAGKLSSGDQRKLSLAIALIGNPSAVVIDEFSCAADATEKQELWEIFKAVLVDKAVFLTTQSLEEALCLGNRIAFMSKRLIGLGTPEEIGAKNVTYDVHFSCQNPKDLSNVKAAMSSISGVRLVDDGPNRFEVPIGSPDRGPQRRLASVAELFAFLLLQKDLPLFVVAKSALERSVIRDANEAKVTS